MNAACQKALESLPLDVRTLELLSTIATSSKPPALLELLRHYELKKDSKTLETIIHKTYFQWSSGLPQHLRAFRTHYQDLRGHWPYEHHRAILSMDSPKSQSMRFLWSGNNPKVLATMQYQRHRWAAEQTPESLTELQRTVLFHEIFQHFMFLKRNPHLCKNRKTLAIPIVEISLRPLGQNISDLRIRNLFKKKIAYVWDVLAQENPALCPLSEKLLVDIVESPQPANNSMSPRALQRMYRRACKGAYVLQQHSNLGLDIAESDLIKML
ncbi:LANO_0C06480g1_1 [Lachancea nothofagi CBS 11611]|uniref:Genetic interactor of prohibitin 5, mitochondrial n=1 Tax=Lachancea nothofagi CBS 11611 TaxID=1266666 RepID=A0A1G4J899_9SACH|nr:LANO_0C06480g1_1 [Lachancea nothofagi CBS 11611]